MWNQNSVIPMPTEQQRHTDHKVTHFPWGFISYPDSKVHGGKMGPIWGRQDPGGPHVGPMNFAIWVCLILKPLVELGPISWTIFFFIVIQIWWKIWFNVTPLYCIITLQNSARPVAQLSCNIQNIKAITPLKLGWKQSKISLEFELWWKNHLWNRPQTSYLKWLMIYRKIFLEHTVQHQMHHKQTSLCYV